MTLGPGYFADLYAAADDPWGLSTRWYEQRKYTLTVASLPRERYRRAFEAGCSVGVLTALLAARCDELLAVDAAAVAVQAAAQRTAGLPHVTVAQRLLPEEWPAGAFDLIVVSEIGYYFGAADFDTLMSRVVGSLEPGGTLIAVHWRHFVADYPRSGDEVHASLAAAAAARGLTRTVVHEELDFWLEVYLRTPPAAESVAQQAGLA